MTLVYRKPCTSPFPEVHTLFDLLEGKDITLEELADEVGYSKDAIMALRRPHKGKRNSNHSFRLMRDLARFAGAEIKVIPLNE